MSYNIANGYNIAWMASALSSINQINRLGTTALGKAGVSGEFRSVIQAAQQKEQGSSVSGISAGDSMDRIFEEASQKYNVDVNLLKAIGKAESGFNASAVSSAGAVGVMQLMPATAKSLGVSNSYDARQNIMGGAKYISQLLDKYNGNVELALAAYNAGSGNVDKYGGIPPFEETQNYVKRVMEYAGNTISTGKNVSETVLPVGAVQNGGAEAIQTRTGDDSYFSINTELFLSLLNIMRGEMELKMASMLMDDSTSEKENGSIWI